MSYTKHDIRKALLNAAKKGNKPYYSDLAKKHSIPKIPGKGYEQRFYDILEEIGVEELKSKRPLLNSLVIRKIESLPGERFFSWYKQHTGIDFTWTKENFEKIARSCQNECFDYWMKVSESQLQKFCKTITTLYPETIKTKKPL